MKSKHYHFIGIGGIGMSGLAKVLISQGFQVSGSDVCNNQLIETLRLRGCPVFIHHQSSNILPDVTDVVYSSSIKSNNCELQEAHRRGLNTIHRGDLLANVVEKFPFSVGVVGTHGKTTTSSILTELYRAHGPTSYIIGGVLNSTHQNAQFESSEKAVVELDESDGSFLKSHVSKAIITNIDHDHMDYYGSEKNLLLSFTNFMSSLKSSLDLIYCADDPILNSIHPKGISYGYSRHSQAILSNYRTDQHRCFFNISYDGKSFQDIELNLIGRFNTLNAAAAFVVAYNDGISESLCRHTLKTFEGVARRQQRHVKAINNTLIINDYAHHPSAIKQTLSSIKESLPNRRIVACLQPHRYSRFQLNYSHYIESLEAADKVFITDIYSAGEDPNRYHVNINNFIKDISKHKPSSKACFCSLNDLESQITIEAQPNDVFVLMGAGSIDTVFKNIVDHEPTHT